jgi:uncharacterized protein YuzE
VKTSYDRSTDSLYVEIRPLPAKRTLEVEEDVLLDLGEDGEPVGYDVQHASEHAELVARLVLERFPQAAE